MATRKRLTGGECLSSKHHLKTGCKMLVTIFNSKKHISIINPMSYINLYVKEGLTVFSELWGFCKKTKP